MGVYCRVRDGVLCSLDGGRVAVIGAWWAAVAFREGSCQVLWSSAAGCHAGDARRLLPGLLMRRQPAPAHRPS